MLLKATDIKQYFYCPRVVYYNYCMPVPRIVTHPMQRGAVEHEALSVLERKRCLKKYGIDTGRRSFHVPFEAPILGITGVLDMLIDQESEAFPVEFKDTENRLNLNAKYQIAVYAMMVEECLSKKVQCGFFYRIPKKLVTPVSITPVLKKNAQKAIDTMHGFILNERMPEPTNNRGKCIECEFKRFCRDVL